jgi:hypothetical protein
MEAQEIKSALDRIEGCADTAKDCLQQGQVPDELRQSVMELHQQARNGRALNDAGQLRDAAMRVEESADRAMKACRSAGQVDQRLQQAIQDAHKQASQLKHQVEQQPV